MQINSQTPGAIQPQQLARDRSISKV